MLCGVGAGFRVLLAGGLIMAKTSYYAVRVGRRPGLYRTWDECKAQVHGFGGAVYKGFATEADARSFIGGPANTVSSVSSVSSSRVASGGCGSVPTPPGPLLSGAGGPSGSSASSSSSSSSFTGVDLRPAAAAAALPSPLMAVLVGRGNGAQPESACCLMRFDGGARNNPGVAGSGSIILGPGHSTAARPVLFKCETYVGPRETNNVAEWTGLVEGLRAAKKLGIRRLLVEGDSELVLKQLSGIYDVHKPHLRVLYDRATALLASSGFLYVGCRHIYRAENAVADALSNGAMDKRASWEWSASAHELAASGLLLPAVSSSAPTPASSSSVGPARAAASSNSAMQAAARPALAQAHSRPSSANPAAPHGSGAAAVPASLSRRRDDSLDAEPLAKRRRGDGGHVAGAALVRMDSDPKNPE